MNEMGKKLLAKEQKNENISIDNQSSKGNFSRKLSYLLNPNYDKDNVFDIIASIENDVDLKQSKLWILICAILICCLGLNTNSTAVVIGAMLISPLMGPILGFGLGLGRFDFALLKKSLLNLGLTALFSVLTATIYFILSPLDGPRSELLARTQPTIYDVLIAFVGGTAGILAGSSKSKGNVITGVAIATALMPPLCTAGYGLASGHISYFWGAIYLFIINSVFIAFSTYVIVIVLQFPKKTILDKKKRVRIHRMMILITLCTIAPSVFLGYRLIQESIIRNGIEHFIQENFNVNDYFVRSTRQISPDTLEIVLWGDDLSQNKIDSLQRLLPKYKLENMHLKILQARDNSATKMEYNKMDLYKFRSEVIQDLYQHAESKNREQAKLIDSLQRVIQDGQGLYQKVHSVEMEAKMLFPEIKSITFSNQIDSLSLEKPQLIAVIQERKKIRKSDRIKLELWLRERVNSYPLIIIFR